MGQFDDFNDQAGPRVVPMNDQFLSAVQSFKKSTTRLNELTDSASSGIVTLENYLAECSIGIEVAIVVDIGSEKVKVGYVNLGRRQRIAVKTPTDTVFKPWTECSREVKLKTIHYVPKLLEALAKKIDDEIKNAETGTSSIESVIRALDIPSRDKGIAGLQKPGTKQGPATGLTGLSGIMKSAIK